MARSVLIHSLFMWIIKVFYIDPPVKKRQPEYACKYVALYTQIKGLISTKWAGSKPKNLNQLLCLKYILMHTYTLRYPLAYPWLRTHCYNANYSGSEFKTKQVRHAQRPPQYKNSIWKTTGKLSRQVSWPAALDQHWATILPRHVSSKTSIAAEQSKLNPWWWREKTVVNQTSAADKAAGFRVIREYTPVYKTGSDGTMVWWGKMTYYKRRPRRLPNFTKIPDGI